MQNSALGFDVGPTSLGHAFIDITNKSLDIGVRIFKASVHPRTQEPLNKKRREARLSRRGIARTKKRVNKVINCLIKKGFLPEEYRQIEGREQLCQKIGNVMYLRSIAADQKITKEEFGLVLTHYAKHRGFLSLKKTQLGDLNNSKDSHIIKLINSTFSDNDEADEDKTEKKVTEYMGAIERTREEVATHGTLGKYQNSILETNLGVPGESLLPVRYSSSNGNTGVNKTRKMVIDEFNMIMDEQMKHHPEINAAMREYLYESIFFQRPISWDRDTISRCALEGDRRRVCDTAKLIAQEARVWMLVNTLKFDGNGTGDADVFLSQAQKKDVATLFNNWSGKSEDVSITAIRGAIGISARTEFNMNSDTIRKCNTTNYRMREAIGSAWDDTPYQDEIIDLLLSDVGKTSIFYSLQNKYGMDETQAIKICGVDLESGYLAYSTKAIRKLLPHLMNGYMIHEATKRAGYRIKKQEIVDRMVQATDTNNPIVNRSLNVLRKVHNAILDDQGRKPDTVGIELVRDLVNNTKKRKEEIKQQNKNRLLNAEARDVIKKTTGIGSPSKDDINKYVLWVEQKKKCIYSGASINLSQLFSASVEIDHILPLRQSFDDGMGNKVVCFAKENQTKADRTPKDAFGKTAQWKVISNAITAAGYPKRKAKKFKVRTHEIQATPMRLLNDTSYVAKTAKFELEKVHSLVQPVKGMMVSKLAKEWGLYSMVGKTVTVGDETLEIKDREDNRHHAIDAIIIAFLSLYSYRFEGILRNNLVEGAAADILAGRKLNIPMPWKGFRDDVKAALDVMVTSHEVNTKTTGAIHDATALGNVPGKNKISASGSYFQVVRDGHTKTYRFGNNHHMDVFDHGPGAGANFKRYKNKLVTMAGVYESKRLGVPVIDKTQDGYWGTLFKGTTFTLNDGDHYVITGFEQGGNINYRQVNYNGIDKKILGRTRVTTLMGEMGLTIVKVDLLGH